MSGILSLLPLALVRMRTRWQLMLPLLAGSVLAVALLCSVVVYGDAIRQLGLEHALRQTPREELDVDLLVYNASVEAESYQRIRAEVEDAISRNLRWFTERRHRGMKGSTLFVNTIGEEGQVLDLSEAAFKQREAASAKQDPRLRSVFLFRDDFDAKTELLTGARPRDVLLPEGHAGPAPEIGVLVTEDTAATHGLAPGDRIAAAPFWESASPYVLARVDGVVRAKDQKERYWRTAMAHDVDGLLRQNYIPLYVSEATFQQGIGRLLPEMLTDYTWAVMVDPARISPRSAALAAFGVDRIGRQLRTQLSVGFLMETLLYRALTGFGVRDVFGRIPLLIVTMMIVAVVLYYLVMVAGVVVERHLGEMALLRSRGAGPPQLLAVYAWEACLLALAALALGPPVAWAVTSGLGYTAVFSSLTAGGPLPARITVEALLVAWMASLVTLAALLLPAFRGVRMELTAFKASSARPSADSVFTRYYLDLFVALVAGVLFWELTQRSSMVTTTLLGQTQVDKALLAAPALVLLAVALLFLRFFPLFMRGLAWLAGRVGAAWLVFGLWQVGRNPMPYALPTLLLMLASAIAMFAANFGATLARSYEDRASYLTGSDVRAAARGLQGEPWEAPLAFDQRPGVESSLAYRDESTFPQQLFNTGDFALLAVDTASLPRVARYRKDFSDQPLAGVMALLEPDTPGRVHGVPIPDNATGLGVWALPADPRRNMQLFARIVDASGRYESVHLGSLDRREWDLLSGRFPTAPLPGDRLERPFRLVALQLIQAGGAEVMPGAVYLDSIETLGPHPATLVDLRDLAQSRVIQDGGVAAGESLEANAAISRPDRQGSAVFVWGPGSPLVTRGLAFQNTTSLRSPLLAVASRTLLETQKISLGDEVTVSVGGHGTLVRIVGMVDFFPTLDPYDGGFLLLNLPAVMERLNTITQLAQAGPNEAWLRLSAETDRELLLTGLDRSARVMDREQVLAGLQADPLVAAGWTGVLRIAFLAVLFATLMGFSVYSLVHAQRRKVEFALLRSLGLSGAGVAGVVLVEQVLVVVIGMALGNWLGMQITSLIMPFLGLSEEGSQVLPPYALAMDWRAVMVVYGAMAMVFMATTLTLIGLFSRSAIQRALRFGEA